MTGTQRVEVPLAVFSEAVEAALRCCGQDVEKLEGRQWRFGFYAALEGRSRQPGMSAQYNHGWVNGNVVARARCLYDEDAPEPVYEPHAAPDAATATQPPASPAAPPQRRVNGTPQLSAPILAGYTGNPCRTCGGLRMRRSGTCETCEDCFATSGCS